MQQSHREKGFAHFGLVIAAIVLIAALAFGAWWVWEKNKKDEPKRTANPSQQDATLVKPDLYQGWQNYSNAAYGISFKYPADWKVREGSFGNPNSSATRQEYGIVLELAEEFKYNETVNIEIHDQSLLETTKWYDKYYAQSSLNQVTKTSDSSKGRQSIQYNIVNSGEESKVYLLSVNNKTYEFASIGNSQLDPDFWPKFNKVFDSLQIN